MNLFWRLFAPTMVPVSASLIVGWNNAALSQPTTAGHPLTASSYPPLTETCVVFVWDGGNGHLEKQPKCHLITSDEANGVFDTINLPDNWILRADDGVRDVNWAATNIVFGQNTTIELTQHSPNTGDCGWPNQNRPAPPGQNGQKGPPGISYPGWHGTNLTITQIVTLSAASLWINTSGGPGGDGGHGCKGQDGGASFNDPSGTFHTPGSNAGRGGDGGDGGPGGNGGAVARVTLIYQSGQPVVFSGSPGPTTQCYGGPVQRPAGAIGATAGIYVYGLPGCGGRPGLGGSFGYGGSLPNGMPDFTKDGHNGQNSTVFGQTGPYTQ